jgi:hypothetical protein
MRALLGVSIVIALVGAFGFFTAWLPSWRAGPEKVTVVTGVVEPTREQLAPGPVRIAVDLHPGRPRRVAETDTPIDDDVPLPEERGRFELGAGPADGPLFFVRAIVELSTFDTACGDAALPPLRFVEEDGRERWVDARTGRPPPPLRLRATRPC